MQEGRQRQAKYAERLRELGLHQVAVWASDTETWMIMQASAGAKAERMDQGADYMTALVDGGRQAVVSSFLAVPGKMALFETQRQERRKAIGVKVVAFRTLPVLVTQVMTANTTWRELADAHPLLEQAAGLGNYHWDTQAFRATCDALGLDPDMGRPRFRPPYEELAEELLIGAAARFDETPDAQHPIGRTTDIVLDVLDLMRADLRPSPSVLDRVRRRWPEIDPARLPQAGSLTELIDTDELLQISDEQHLANHNVAMQHTVVEFLPSRHGAGYSATISGFFGDYESDGWVSQAYGDLRGLAVEPVSEHLTSLAWLRVVRRRLSEQGVIFMPREKVADYLESEGVYWIDRWGGSGKWRDVRMPSWRERLLWRLNPPPLHVDRELALRELARRGETAGKR